MVFGCINDYSFEICMGGFNLSISLCKIKNFCHIFLWFDKSWKENSFIQKCTGSFVCICPYISIILYKFCISSSSNHPKESKDENNDVLMTQERTGEADVAVSADSDAVTVSLRGVVSFLLLWWWYEYFIYCYIYQRKICRLLCYKEECKDHFWLCEGFFVMRVGD